MSSVTDSITEIFQLQAAQGNDLKSLMRYPLPPHLISQTLEETGIVLPDELMELYSLHNGADPTTLDNDAAIFPKYRLLGLQECIDRRKKLQGISSDPGNPVKISSHLFPFMANPDAEHLLIDLEGSHAILEQLKDSDPTPAFKDLSSMLKAAATAWKQHVFQYIEPGKTETDWDAWNSLKQG